MFSFLRFFTSKPTKKRFVRVLEKEIRRLGITDDLGYHEGMFSIRLGPTRPRLGAVYAAYCDAITEEAKKDVLEDFLAPFNPNVPPLDWALKEMLRVLPESTLEAVSNATDGEIARMHFGLGMWIRNNLGLWSGSRLCSFLEGHGFRCADAMSRALLWTLRAQLRGEDALTALEAAKQQ